MSSPLSLARRCTSWKPVPTGERKKGAPCCRLFLCMHVCVHGCTGPSLCSCLCMASLLFDILTSCSWFFVSLTDKIVDDNAGWVPSNYLRGERKVMFQIV